MSAARQFFVGLDFGLVRDPTAVAVLERTESQAAASAAIRTKHDIIELRRLPLGTLYTAVCAAVVRNLALLPGRRFIAADATGVGVPVIEMLHAAIAAAKVPDVTLLACVITGGVQATGTGNVVRIPKREIILQLASDMQTGLLQIAADIEHAELLVRELRNFRFRVNSLGSESYEAWRDNEHDDIVFAAALANWAATRYWHPIIPRPVPVRRKPIIGPVGASELTMEQAWTDHRRTRRRRR